jgi:hypothetical protein
MSFEVYSERHRPDVPAELRTVDMDFFLSLSDLGGGGYYWVSERPNRLTTAARLR